MGRGSRALCHEVRVSFRRPRPHECFTVPPGFRAVVAIADTPDGAEEQPWLVPHRDAKRALNPKYRSASRDLAAGIVPDGWQRL